MEDNSLTNNQQLDTKPQGYYNVQNVILIESEFKRIADIVAEVAIIPEIIISHETQSILDQSKFGVALTLEYRGKQNEMIICNSKIKMLGIFEKINEPALNEDAFKKINAPAIIYPFVREHLYNLCLKAGIANVLLPTVNFKA